MVFFGYVKGAKVSEHTNVQENQQFVYFEPPKIVQDLRAKYISILRNPVDDKEPLAWCHFQLCNQDTLKRNSKYKPEYRAQKVLAIQTPKAYFKRPHFTGSLAINDP